jgi:hypothetical protein
MKLASINAPLHAHIGNRANLQQSRSTATHAPRLQNDQIKRTLFSSKSVIQGRTQARGVGGRTTEESSLFAPPPARLLRLALCHRSAKSACDAFLLKLSALHSPSTPEALLLCRPLRAEASTPRTAVGNWPDASGVGWDCVKTAAAAG